MYYHLRMVQRQTNAQWLFPPIQKTIHIHPPSQKWKLLRMQASCYFSITAVLVSSLLEFVGFHNSITGVFKFSMFLHFSGFLVFSTRSFLEVGFRPHRHPLGSICTANSELSVILDLYLMYRGRYALVSSGRVRHPLDLPEIFRAA